MSNLIMEIAFMQKRIYYRIFAILVLDVSETLSNFWWFYPLIPNGTMKEDFFFNLLEMNIQEKESTKHAIRSGQGKVITVY